MYLKLECTVWICSCKPQCVHVNVRQRSVRFGVVSSLYSKSKSKKEETISSIKQFIFTFSIMIKNILRALSWHLLWYRDVCHMINMLKLLEIWQWKEWNVTKNQAKRLCKRHTQPSYDGKAGLLTQALQSRPQRRESGSLFEHSSFLILWLQSQLFILVWIFTLT